MAFITVSSRHGLPVYATSVLSDIINTEIPDTGGQFNHVPGGGNVLSMDGHAAFLRYPSGWPISPLVAGLNAVF